MLQGISIGATRNIEVIKDMLWRELSLLERDGLKVNLDENPAGQVTFLSCRVSGHPLNRYNSEDATAVIKQYVANALSDLILGQWEKQLLYDIIRENYYYFNEEERNTIYNYALGYINHCGDSFPCESLYQIKRKSKIVQKMMEFFRNHNNINIEGFIRFRLKDYIFELQEAADRAVDDFLMEREYKEFIQLLKYFVEIQDPRTDIVHVVIKPNGVFKLYDGQHQVINSDYLEGFIVDLLESEINYEDLLISALITIAPGEIVFHPGKAESPQNTIETIKDVFTHRVKECAGCDLCSGKQN